MSESFTRFQRTAWLVVALLTPVAMLNYLDRQMLAAMKSSVVSDITSINTDERWGMLLASFKWVYAGLSPFGGYLADRFSRRLIILVSLFVWSAVTWATGHVHTYEEMLWTRALMGISEACYIPAALALISDFHFGPTRSKAVGIHQMAIYVGVILGGYSGHVADAPDFGWRWAFSAAGIAGVLYTLPLWWLLPDSPQRDRPAESRPAPGTALHELFSNSAYILLVLCFTLPAIAGWIVKDWMPVILKEQLNISQGQAGVTATLWTSLASMVGALTGGWLADRWMRSSIRGRTFVSALGMSLLIPALFGVSQVQSVMAAAMVLIVFGMGWGLFDCNNMPILCQIVRPELRATGYGVMNLVSISIGGVADWGYGIVRDEKVPLPLVFGTFATIALVSVILMLMIRPREEFVRESA